ncbi:hypothetical protein CQW23_27060 [Capsicum baccatum]|uniref:NB-ARC domain-containing protein n=1 Tax=Capsicum baccatum TaxID=33114 RepID=A0A2G2VQL3_CAPBA|nr:hypothetical protein CQW23_27060 [Capsicum baccatum]
MNSIKDDNNLNRLQVKLKEKLYGKRFLIVLDDMWNDNYEKWDELRSLFVQGAEGKVDEWKDILRSEIWEQNLNGILPALMLSYNDLPAHLKQCFSYCAIHPKDYQFCKEQVIHLWIANGLVQKLHSGNQYFNELRSRSLFERVSESSERDGGKFLMHDLVNDFAQIASSKLCVRLEEFQGSNMLEQSQHFSYSMGLGGDFEKLKSPIKSEQLRTLLPIDIQDL